MSDQVSSRVGTSQLRRQAGEMTGPDVEDRPSRHQFSMLFHGIASDPNLTPSTLRVLIGLTYWAMDRPATTVSDGRLAIYADLSISTVKRAITDLERAGYITIRDFKPTRNEPTGRQITLNWVEDASIIPQPPDRGNRPSLEFKTSTRRNRVAPSTDDGPRAASAPTAPELYPLQREGCTDPESRSTPSLMDGPYPRSPVSDPIDQRWSTPSLADEPGPRSPVSDKEEGQQRVEDTPTRAHTRKRPGAPAQGDDFDPEWVFKHSPVGETHLRRTHARFTCRSNGDLEFLAGLDWIDAAVTQLCNRRLDPNTAPHIEPDDLVRRLVCVFDDADPRSIVSYRKIAAGLLGGEIPRDDVAACLGQLSERYRQREPIEKPGAYLTQILKNSTNHEWPCLDIYSDTAASFAWRLENLARDRADRATDGTEPGPGEEPIDWDLFLSDDQLIEEIVEDLQVMFGERSDKQSSRFMGPAQDVLARKVPVSAVYRALTSVISKFVDREGKPIHCPGSYFLQTIRNNESQFAEIARLPVNITRGEFDWFASRYLRE